MSFPDHHPRNWGSQPSGWLSLLKLSVRGRALCPRVCHCNHRHGEASRNPPEEVGLPYTAMTMRRGSMLQRSHWISAMQLLGIHRPSMNLKRGERIRGARVLLFAAASCAGGWGGNAAISRTLPFWAPRLICSPDHCSGVKTLPGRKSTDSDMLDHQSTAAIRIPNPWSYVWALKSCCRQGGLIGVLSAITVGIFQVTFLIPKHLRV